MKTDEEVRSCAGASRDSRTELPYRKVVTADRVRGRPDEDEVRNEEGDGRLVETVEHEAEELGASPFETEDSASVQLRVSHREFGADILIEL